MNVKMEQTSTEEFPTKQCSKREECIDEVNWNLVAASTEETIGFPLS